MKISDIEGLDIGTKGFSVEAQVLLVWDVRTIKGERGSFKRQNMLLVDDKRKIFATISDGFISSRDIGKPIAITGCELEEFEDKNGDLQLSCNSTSSGAVKIERTASKKGSDRVSPAKSLAEIVGEAVDEAQAIIQHPAYLPFVELCKTKGLTSEDARALVIGRIIQKERNR